MYTFSGRLLAPALLLLLGAFRLVLAADTTDRGAVEAAAQAWTQAFNARNTEALLALTTEDVVLMDASIAAPVSGREAARAALAQALGAAKGRVANASKEIVVVDDVAWRIGALTHQLSSPDVPGRGQSLEIWKRVQGEWKLHRQMSSGILAQQHLLPRPVPSEPVLDKPTN